MSERSPKLGLPALALAVVAALSSCKDAPKPRDDSQVKKGPSVEAMAQLDVRARLEEVARFDLSDGSDDLDEKALKQRKYYNHA